MIEIKNNNFGEVFERCMFMMHFQDKLTKKDIWVQNIHLNIPKEIRLASTKLINLFTQDILKKNPSAKIISAGDFNTLPYEGFETEEMLKNITKSEILIDATEKLTIYDSKIPYFHTYYSYPYDFGLIKESEFKANGKFDKLLALPPEDRRKEIGHIYATELPFMGGHLDRVFYHGFSKVSATLNPIPLFLDNAPKNYTGEEIKQYNTIQYEKL